MCGRYTLHTEKEALAERFDFDPGDLAELAPHYNIAPTQNVVTVRAASEGRVASTMRWGLVPYFANALNELPLMINARLESIESKPSFREPFRRQRCLILADGFYEWQSPHLPAKRRIPHFIGLANDAPFAFAGIWSTWRARDLTTELVHSCAILTTAANDAMRALHDRMPVILPRDAEARWLDPTLDDDVAALRALLVPVDPVPLQSHPVSTRVNSVKNDDPSLLTLSHDDPQLGFF